MVPLILLLYEIMCNCFLLDIICITHIFLCSFVTFLPVWRFCTSMCCPFMYHDVWGWKGPLEVIWSNPQPKTKYRQSWFNSVVSELPPKLPASARENSFSLTVYISYLFLESLESFCYFYLNECFILCQTRWQLSVWGAYPQTWGAHENILAPSVRLHFFLPVCALRRKQVFGQLQGGDSPLCPLGHQKCDPISYFSLDGNCSCPVLVLLWLIGS